MIIDCGTCTVRGDACADCVVTFLTIPVRAGAPTPADAGAVPRTAPESVRDRSGPAVAGAAVAGQAVAGSPVDLDDAERAAIAVLAGSGLVPPLRLRAV